MELYDSTKSILENLYLLSGPILALFGIIIFYQIYYAKKSIELARLQIIQAKEHLKTISKREAATISAERINFFSTHIIPLGDKLFEERKNVNFPEFTEEIQNFKYSEISTWDLEYSKKFVEMGIKNPKILGQELINLLEGFSTYFTNGIANESIAFSTIGRTFCSYIENYYPLICLTQKENEVNNPYCNLIKLYGMWKNRMKVMESEILIKREEKIMAEKMKEFDKIKQESNNIKPLGTN